MVKYIFDLDLTLYSENDFIDHSNPRLFYNSFKEKRMLKQLLSLIDYKKFILTNASYDHAVDVMKRLNITDQFHSIISSDIANDEFKPDKPIYDLAIKTFKVNRNETVYFFEDQIDNLKTAKKEYKWNTVLITPQKMRKPQYVDYIFPTIEEALLYFIVKDKMKKNIS
jgi:HAD superfamily hydrolase (TIGR01509 family)